MKRVFELWIGDQESGKTYQLRRRALGLLARPRIRSVHVVAPPGEWIDLPEIEGSFERLEPRQPRDRSWLVERDERPAEIVLWDVQPERPESPRELDAILRDVVSLGDCAVVVDEAWSWAPAGATWRGAPTLLDIVLRGRHIENVAGQLRPTHLVLASQYSRSLSHLVREQARTVMVGKLEGELGAEWVRQFRGADAAARVARLGPHEWTAIRGRDPRRG